MATKTVKKVNRKTPAKKSVAKPKANEERVKTYRVLRDGTRVGYSVRNFGDFMPEAKTLPTLRTLLNTDVIEEVWVDQEEFDAWKEDQAKRDEALNAELVVDDEDEGEDEEPRPVSRKVKPKKKVAKKSANRIVKKGKTSGRKLEEQRV